jgi:hypothetical protein
MTPDREFNDFEDFCVLYNTGETCRWCGRAEFDLMQVPHPDGTKHFECGWCCSVIAEKIVSEHAREEVWSGVEVSEETSREIVEKAKAECAANGEAWAE